MAAYNRFKNIDGNPPPYLGSKNTRQGVVATKVDRKADFYLSRLRGKAFTYFSSFPGEIPGPAYVDSSLGYQMAYASQIDCANLAPKVYAQAYDKMVSRLVGLQKANVGVIVGEARSSLAMIANRAGSLLRFWQLARRGNFVGAARALDLYDSKQFKKYKSTFKRQGRDALVDATNFALEVKFGWVPLVGDIYEAVRTLEKQYPPQKVSAKASAEVFVNRETYGPPVWTTSSGKCTISYRLYCRVNSVNPNLYLASSLGLVNPVNIAWQLVPLSFVVDWFLPVGKFLNSYTDLVGFELRHCLYDYRGQAVGFHDLDGWYGRRKTDSSGFVHERIPVGAGFSIPSFKDRLALPSFDVGKAVTAIQLLVQRWGK